jgi:flagellar M-ring protein FliF
MLALAILGVVVGGYLFMSWAGKPTYAPLFSNLSSSDAASMTQKLSANKIPYQLTEGGQQIMVPQADVYQQRLDMAAAGLPSSGSQGYSLLDNAGVTTSEFQQQVEYQQAVSDQLEKTIESMNGVSSAIVNVVIPQQSLFATSAGQPSASVLVSLQPGTSLGAEQVQAVVHLVASSIEGLAADNVTVVDQNGDVLNAPGTNAGNVAAGSMQQQQTLEYEQSLDNSLQDMLATVLGPGNAVVHTNAQLDFSQTQISSNIYDPNNQGPIPVQQASSKQTYVGPAAGAAAIGILGGTTLPVVASAGKTVLSSPTSKSGSATAAATGSAKTTKTTKTTAKTAKTATTTKGTAKTAKGTATTTPGVTTTTVPTYSQVGASQQNVVSEVTKTVDSAPGTLIRLSVAVVVDSSVKGVNVGTIKKLVSAAAGLQPTRGDSIQVAFVPFNQSAAKAQAAQLEAAASANSQAALMGEARTGAVALVVLALLVFAFRRITKTTRVPMALPNGYQPLELEPGNEDEDEDDPTMALPVVAPVREAAYVAVPNPLQAEVSQLGLMIEREPERIAEMLRAWLEASPSER